MEKKNFLFVLPWLPFPLKTGGHQAIFNGLLAVKEYANIIITYVDNVNNPVSETDKRNFCSFFSDSITIEPYAIHVHEKTLTEKKPIAIQLYHLIKRYHHKLIGIAKFILKYDSPKGIEAIEKPYKNWIHELEPKDEHFVSFISGLIEEYNIDLVQCEMIRNASLVYSLPDNIKKVFVHHELRSVVNALKLDSMPGDATEKSSYLKFFQTNEVGVLNMYDCVVTLSQVDKIKLEKMGVTTKIYPSFAIVTTAKANTQVISDRHNVLTFIGTDDHNPNLVGIRWFLENCWGALLTEDASYSLQIIGNWSQEVKDSFITLYKNITFLGFVDDLESAVKNTIMIVPITIGSGIRMKILEASTIGVPVVTTSIGVEGIPFENGRHCFIADAPELFIRSIVKLRDGNTRFSLIEEAGKVIKEHYSFESLKINRVNLYKALFDE